MPCYSKSNAGIGSIRKGGLSGGPSVTSQQCTKGTTQDGDSQVACTRLYNTTRYRLPEELDSVFIKSLLHRIRADLHEKGFLESPAASLTRYEMYLAFWISALFPVCWNDHFVLFALFCLVPADAYVVYAHASSSPEEHVTGICGCRGRHQQT